MKNNNTLKISRRKLLKGSLIAGIGLALMPARKAAGAETAVEQTLFSKVEPDVEMLPFLEIPYRFSFMARASFDRECIAVACGDSVMRQGVAIVRNTAGTPDTTMVYLPQQAHEIIKGLAVSPNGDKIALILFASGEVGDKASLTLKQIDVRTRHTDDIFRFDTTRIKKMSNARLPCELCYAGDSSGIYIANELKQVVFIGTEDGQTTAIWNHTKARSSPYVTALTTENVNEISFVILGKDQMPTKVWMRGDAEVRRMNFGHRSSNRIVNVCSFDEEVAYTVVEDDGRLLIIWEDMKSDSLIASTECVRNGYALSPSLILPSSLILKKVKTIGNAMTPDIGLVRWITG